MEIIFNKSTTQDTIIRDVFDIDDCARSNSRINIKSMK
jgi:hypothetical protein